MNIGKLIIVDGTAVLYRSFYAIRELSTSAGKPTNAVFGFIRMLRQMKEVWSPSHWVVVFDGGLPKERKALLESYKAQRAAMPGPLKEQIPTAEDYLDRAGITYIRMAGEEADDLIASIAEKARGDFTSILIATNDKDIFQLVDDRVKIIPTAGKDGLLDSEGVKAKTGVYPANIVDWLALVGDNSDNIPGVPGVGPKTAARLIEQFGGIDVLYANLGNVDNARTREALDKSRELVARNRAIVMLRRDLTGLPEWQKLEVRNPSVARLLPFFESMEFHSIAKEIKEMDLFL